MPEMPGHFKALLRSPLYSLVARRVVLPWALQGVRPAGRALEVGCGTGVMAARLLTRFPDLRLVATDYDPEMVAAAQEALRRFEQRAEVEPADAVQLPFEDDHFDVVFAFAMFHHAGDWERALAEAIRVLRPGGRLVGYDLLEGGPLHRRRGQAEVHAGHARSHPDTGQGLMIRSPQELEESIRSLPVSDVRVRRSTGSAAVRFLATKSGRRGPG